MNEHLDRLVADANLEELLESAERLLAEAVRRQTNELLAHESEPDETETYLTEVYRETVQLFLRTRVLESKVSKEEARIRRVNQELHLNE